MSAEAKPDASQAELAGKVIGLVLAGLAVLAIGLWVGNRGSSAEEGEPLALRIVSPADGDTARRPVPLVFETRARLRPAPEGWRAGRLHLHAVVDGVEHMPAAADVRPLGGNRFEWRLLLPPGTHNLFLQWSGPDHRPITTGQSREVEIIVGYGEDRQGPSEQE